MGSNLKIHRYAPKLKGVEAVQIDVNNMTEVAAWVDGVVRMDDRARNYVELPAAGGVTSCGYVGMWVVRTEGRFSFYTKRVFERTFDKDSGALVEES